MPTARTRPKRSFICVPPGRSGKTLDPSHRFCIAGLRARHPSPRVTAPPRANADGSGNLSERFDLKAAVAHLGRDLLAPLIEQRAIRLVRLQRRPAKR